MSEKFYITTAIAYASRKPHIGNTYEIVFTDAIARFKRLIGCDVFFLTGTDEHGQKIEDCAKEFNKKESAQVDTHEGDPEAEEITALVLERTQAKKDKDFAKADQIRNDLQARGVIIIDTPNGPIWKRN